MTAELGPLRRARASGCSGVFDVLGELFAEPGFRGCAFVNASAEARRGSAVEQVSDAARAWVRALFARAGARGRRGRPAAPGRQLMLLYDGAHVGAADGPRPEQRRGNGRAAAEVLLDAATSA